MSAQMQTQTIRAPFARTTVIALIAFAIGAAGTLAIGELVGSQTRVEVTTPALWDTGRLEAMEGRQLAEAATASVLWDAGRLQAMEGRVQAAAIEATTPVVVWDSWMSQAMEGRQLAAAVASGTLWDAGRLQAMEGRQLAESVTEPVAGYRYISEQSLIGELSNGQR